jgi:hypothetical protein
LKKYLELIDFFAKDCGVVHNGSPYLFLYFYYNYKIAFIISIFEKKTRFYKNIVDKYNVILYRPNNRKASTSVEQGSARCALMCWFGGVCDILRAFCR